MADDNLMSQDEIERLLNQAKSGPASPPPAEAAAPPVEPPAAEPPPLAAAPAASLDDLPADSKLLGQEDIDRLLGTSGAAKPEPRAAAAPTVEEGNMAPADLDYLLNQAEQALASIQTGTAAPAPPGVGAFKLEEFAGAPPSQDNATLDLLRDVELDLKIELGRTNMYLEDVLRLRKGSVVPLDKLAGDPVDIYVNDRLVARGEVLVLNDNFCVRVAELIAGVNPAA
jgi:flagellar motor switch protein FliN/FliY